MGTWDMLLAYNAVDGGRGRIFAAGMPLAGTHRRADPDEAARVLRDVPIWAIHGGSDREISPDWDRRMAKLLSGSPTFRYTEAPGIGHDVWDTFYARPDVWHWLFAQASRAE
jgi:pimeloyl-ACP methyl ester carboxylesterase